MSVPYISDPRLLHKTVKRHPNHRLSIDIGAIASDLLTGKATNLIPRALYVQRNLAFRHFGNDSDKREPPIAFNTATREKIGRIIPFLLAIEDMNDLPANASFVAKQSNLLRLALPKANPFVVPL